MSTNQECPKILEIIGVLHIKKHQSVVFRQLKECFLVVVFFVVVFFLFVWFFWGL